MDDSQHNNASSSCMETTTRNQNCVHEPTVGNPKFWLFCMPIRQSSSSYSFQDVEVVLEDSTYVNPWNDGTEVNSDIVLVHSIPLMCRRWETVPVCCPSTLLSSFTVNKEASSLLSNVTLFVHYLVEYSDSSLNREFRVLDSCAVCVYNSQPTGSLCQSLAPFINRVPSQPMVS